MSERVDYLGKGVGLVDDKGRVAIPNTLRAALAQNAPRPDGKDGGTVLVGVHPDFPCLIAHDRGYVEHAKNQLIQRQAESGIRTGSKEFYAPRMRGASVEPVPFDGSGRFILPAVERELANITDIAFFLGDYESFMIWDPRTLIAHDGVDEMAKRHATILCRDKGIAL
ncbi:division/cell wall cluster transcriptional repressor MraZ [Sphingomonas sp. ABOLG]|uniref:division/cell wall cluster transcriptional repressor MraZ n=1 Tax=Sphingomonas sp. ABOLG TaxID=1985880 RepID=UPI000F7E30AA|nr:division/cell wall cluster transcriptional repressor MraZ [Sphingomonas sp. ABOLG]RSV17807.1 division/cell wall cluster transcriptional repressor MraZ [Sphingomonas sp. ABOLG]